jgi:tetratricopeptide (TPR) repeat protein
VTLSESLHEIHEDSEQSPAAATAARKQREIDQLLNLFKPRIRLLQAQETSRRRAQSPSAAGIHPAVYGISQSHHGPAFPGSCQEWSWLLDRRLGRIESNLSYIYAGKLQDYTKALEHANNSVGNYPSWSKAHSRRAVALEGLGRLVDAEAAISKALEVLKDEEVYQESSSSTSTTISKTRTEFQMILSRIDNSILEESDSINDLQTCSIRKLKISTDYAQAGSFTSCFEAGIQDRVAVFLSPRDVANLEQTCRGFAAQPERMRRSALSSPLWSLCPTHNRMEKLIEEYCSETLKEPRVVLRTLMTSVLALVPKPAEAESRVPSWLDRLLSHASVDARNIIQSLCIANHDSWRGPVSLLAFENACFQCHHMLSGYEDDDDEGMAPIFERDDDGQMLRIIAWLSPILGNSNDDNAISYPQLRELREEAFVIMSNIISRGVTCRVALAQTGESSPIFAATMALTSVFLENVPGEFPCEKPMEMDWNYSVPDLTGYFNDKEPRVIRRWIAALRKLVQWAESVQPHSEEFALCTFIIVLGALQENGRMQVGWAVCHQEIDAAWCWERSSRCCFRRCRMDR